MNNVSGSNTTWESPPDMTAEYLQPSDGDSGKQVGRIAGLVTVGIMVILLVVCVCLDRRNRKKRHSAPTQPQPHGPRQHIRQPATSNPQMLQSPIALPSSSSVLVHGSPHTFSYEELVKATDDFSETNYLGEGGYGTVHKGVLPDGRTVAIKKLKSGSKQGEKEFKAEVTIISRVHHKNLVSLVGCCISEGRKILVYEFVPNGTLHLHLHGKEKSTIDWPTRMQIALGSANGLAYLHESCNPQIIHRDIKTSNILLDDKFEAKVTDFGLAKFSSNTKSHVSTDVKGTFGYIDPAYFNSGQLTDKADIFSFGVVLLELITGRESVHETKALYQSTKPSVKQAVENGNFDDDLIDPKLQNKYNRIEMRRMVTCAAACVRDSPSNRPTMKEIVRFLEGYLENLNAGIKPGDSGEFGSYGSTSYDANQHTEDLKEHNKLLQEGNKEDTNVQSELSTIYESAQETAL